MANKIYVNETTEFEVVDSTARGGNPTAEQIANWNAKADASTTYTKTEINTALGNKADKSTTYTKTEVDTALSSKADTSAIPTTIAQLTDDSTHRVVTDVEKASWNGKSDFSGDYNDLTNRPTIPSVPSNVSEFTNDSGYLTLATLPVYTGVVI